MRLPRIVGRSALSIDAALLVKVSASEARTLATTSLRSTGSAVFSS